MSTVVKSACVTGCAGFIGSHLVDKLFELGWKVDGIDDLSGGDLKNLNIKKLRTFSQIDFADPNSLDFIRNSKHDVVFHLAARPRVSYSVENPTETNMVNLHKSVQLLEAAKNGKVGRVVFSSSSSVYGGADLLPTPASYRKNPKSPYALQKSVVEDYCKLFSSLYGLDTISLRYFNVFGPRAKGDGPYATAVSAWISAIKNGTPLRSDGSGDQSRDMCYVDNVVSANILAANHTGKFAGETFNVACQESVTNNQVLAWFTKKWPEAKIKTASWRPGDVMHTLADISDTSSVLGYKPLVRFWDGLEITVKKEGL